MSYKNITIVLFCVVVLLLPVSAIAGYKFERDVRYDVIASSELKSPKYSYATGNLKDENPGNAWCEGDQNNGVGQWLQLDLKDKNNILSDELLVNILPGYAKSRKLFTANARPAKVRIIVAEKLSGKVLIDTQKTLPTISDSIETKTFNIKLGQKVNVGTLQIKIIIDEVYNGAKYADLCISEVQVFNKVYLDKYLDGEEGRKLENIEDIEFERLLPIAEKGNPEAIQGLIRMADGEYYRTAEGGEYLGEIFVDLFYQYPERFLFLLSKQSQRVRAKVEDVIASPVTDKYSPQEIADKVRSVKNVNMTKEYKASIMSEIKRIHKNRVK